MKLLLFALINLSLFAADTPEDRLRALLETKGRSVALPSGTIEISRELLIPPSVHDLDIYGSNTTLKAAPNFRGRALLVLSGGKNIRIHDLSIDGNRDAVGRMSVLPPAGMLFSRAVPDNGLLAEGVSGLEISQLKIVHVAGFAVLAGSSRGVRIHDVEITESGGFNSQRRNNGTGGIALEDGVSQFEVRRCQFGGIRGNAITLRSTDHGLIAQNEFAVLARDAIQASASAFLTIDNNRARRVGAPVAEVDGRAECMRMDRINDSTLTANLCEEALLGALVLGGSRNRIAGNRFLHLNLAQKNEPGIVLDAAASSNIVKGNEISGAGMSGHCIASAPGAATNDVAKNDCSDEESVAGLQRAIQH